MAAAPPPAPPPPDRRRLLSYKTLVQVGGAAAAIASIIGLLFTVGDRAFGLFGSEAQTGVHLDRVALETMPLRTYLQAKERKRSVTGLGYSEADLDRDVLVVNFDARFEGSSKGVAFPIRLTLLKRDAGGRIDVVDERQDPYTIDASEDDCGCHDFYSLEPLRGPEYRAQVQILRPNTPDAKPRAEKESDWYRP